MGGISWPRRQWLATGALAVLIVGALASDTYAQLGSPSTKGRSAPSSNPGRDGGHHDRGYRLFSSHHDLSSISQLILALTKDLVSILDRVKSGGSGHEIHMDTAIIRFTQLQDAIRLRRRLQREQMFEQLVNEMVREDAEATRAGKPPSQQQADRGAEKANQQINDQQKPSTPGGQGGLAMVPGGGAPIQPPPPPSQPAPQQKPKPSQQPPEERLRGEATKVLQRILTSFDDPSNLKRPQTPAEAIQQLKDKQEEAAQHVYKAAWGGQFGEKMANVVREVFDPAIQQMEKQEQDGMAWLEMGAKLINAPTTPAERAESNSVRDWRQQEQKLQSEVRQNDKDLRKAERALQHEHTPNNEDQYRESRNKQTKSRQKLEKHRGLDPKTFQPAGG